MHFVKGNLMKTKRWCCGLCILENRARTSPQALVATSHPPTLSNFHPSHNFYSSHCFHSSRHFHLHENTRITSCKKEYYQNKLYICATMLPLCSSESSFDLWMQQSLHPLHFYNSVTVCFKTVFGGFWTIAGNQHMVFSKWHMTL